ncbi:hypothetical protein BDB01DRAFT_901515 [Pilobolus umbonatus]|nr:hypothetical protein BDB01DRAFT_901515 [Pilobolus umbonatus]
MPLRRAKDPSPEPSKSKKIEGKGNNAYPMLEYRITFKRPLRSDGVDLEFICRRKSHDVGRVLTPMEIAQRDLLDTATVWALDPGVKDVLIAADGHNPNRTHRIRKTSTNDYYYLAGLKKATITRTKIKRDNP